MRFAIYCYDQARKRRQAPSCVPPLSSARRVAIAKWLSWSSSSSNYNNRRGNHNRNNLLDMFITMAFGVIASGPSHSSPFSRFISFAISYFLYRLLLWLAALIAGRLTTPTGPPKSHLYSLWQRVLLAVCSRICQESTSTWPSASARLRLQLCLTHARKCQQCAWNFQRCHPFSLAGARLLGLPLFPHRQFPPRGSNLTHQS